MKKIGLALGSGGARGFCHIGVLQAFEEYKIPIHCIAGCSHGALVGGCYAAGVSVDEMKKAAKKSTIGAIMDVNVSLKNNGLMKGRRASNIVKKLVGGKKIEDCAVRFCNGVQYKYGEVTYFQRRRTAICNACKHVDSDYISCGRRE